MLSTHIYEHVFLVFKCSDVPLTSGDPHVGSHLEAWVDVDDGAPHHVTGKVSRDELHGGCQVVSGLVALLCAVICGAEYNIKTCIRVRACEEKKSKGLFTQM